MLRSMPHDWKPKIRPMLEMYADRVPGSLVEEKDYSLVWHYRAADERQGRVAAQELTDDLLSFVANIDLQVLQGSKIVEVRTSGRQQRGRGKGVGFQRDLRFHLGRRRRLDGRGHLSHSSRFGLFNQGRIQRHTRPLQYRQPQRSRPSPGPTGGSPTGISEFSVKP